MPSIVCTIFRRPGFAAVLLNAASERSGQKLTQAGQVLSLQIGKCGHLFREEAEVNIMKQLIRNTAKIAAVMSLAAALSAGLTACGDSESDNVGSSGPVKAAAATALSSVNAKKID